MNLEDEIDTSIDPGGSGADGIDAKSKMLIKKGKVAVKANRQVHKASVAIKRMRRRQLKSVLPTVSISIQWWQFVNSVYLVSVKTIGTTYLTRDDMKKPREANLVQVN